MSFKDLKKLMTAMAISKEEMESFLSHPRLARMATISNGKPHIVPVWYYYDEVNIIIPVIKGTKKIKNIKNNPTVSIASTFLSIKDTILATIVNQKLVQKYERK